MILGLIDTGDDDADQLVRDYVTKAAQAKLIGRRYILYEDFRAALKRLGVLPAHRSAAMQAFLREARL